MQEGRQIALSFLALTVRKFPFQIYRKVYDGETKTGLYANCVRHRLPVSISSDVRDNVSWAQYWISLVKLDGFESFICQEDFNRQLTQYYLHQALVRACEQHIDQSRYFQSGSAMRKFVSFVLETHREGFETVWLMPYYLEVANIFGFLIDFEFKKAPDISFSRRVQQLSLSLDKYYRSNTNYYIDRYSKIQSFLFKYYSVLFPLNPAPGLQLNIETNLYALSAELLETKRYIFADNKEKNSQFNGIREYGPLESVKQTALFYFICHEQDVDSANQLFRALRGDTYRSNFPGMESMFGVRLTRDNIRGKLLSVFDKDGFQRVIDELASQQDKLVMPILILPSKYDPESSRAYYLAKYLFINRNIPVQVVTLDIIKNTETLKWSVSNIGLQIFAKLGGKPWKVKPKTEHCLIVGIAQAHEEVMEGTQRVIRKYFAYSVLTDSSGLYLEMNVLGHSGEQSAYLTQLRENLRRLIEKYRGQFTKIVIHTPYKVRRFELESIKSLLDSMALESANASTKFVVIKVNTDNRYFGYDLSFNSKVPYESTYVRLSSREYLLWSEGMQYHNPNVNKRFAGPTHIEFYYSSSDPRSDDTNYLQDVLNLSGANWRGFNAKSMPVSILYCQLVARFIKEFTREGNRDYKIDNLKPWFL